MNSESEEVAVNWMVAIWWNVMGAGMNTVAPLMEKKNESVLPELQNWKQTRCFQKYSILPILWVGSL
jgi:hypothetical protein